MSLIEITSWAIEKWRSAKLKSGATPGTVNRDLAELKAALSKAVKWGLLESHPLANLKLSKIDRNPKVRYLSEEEEFRLRRALTERSINYYAARERGNTWRRQRGYAELPADAGDHLRPIVLLALNTGLRRGEIFNLRWGDINIEKAMVTGS